MDQFIRSAAAAMTVPKLVVMGSGATRLSMIALDLDHSEQALATAKLLAEQTGRTVTVRDADGEVLGIVRAPSEN
jgi:hypothetical protein